MMECHLSRRMRRLPSSYACWALRMPRSLQIVIVLWSACVRGSTTYQQQDSCWVGTPTSRLVSRPFPPVLSNAGDIISLLSNILRATGKWKLYSIGQWAIAVVDLVTIWCWSLKHLSWASSFLASYILPANPFNNFLHFNRSTFTMHQSGTTPV